MTIKEITDLMREHERLIIGYYTSAEDFEPVYRGKRKNVPNNLLNKHVVEIFARRTEIYILYVLESESENEKQR